MKFRIADCGLRIQWAIAVAVACAAAAACRRSAPTERPNILLVTIDTFRADRLGPGFAPNLDRLAARAKRFTNARTAVPLTLPSHTTILTGLLPTAHGVRVNGLTPLDEARPTVATLLRSSGYATAAFIGAFVLDRRFGLARGFDVYDDQIPRDPLATDRLDAERPGAIVVDGALAWLNAYSAGLQPPASSRQAPASSRQPPDPRPFFAWIHLYDPHAPYTPPPEFARANPYDGEIAYADSQVARVLAWLSSTRLDSRTLVIVAGDHGEGLGDHGEATHGMLLYDSTLRVPLVISEPGAAAAAVGEPVSLVDIAPTMLRAAHVPVPASMYGRDLRDVRDLADGRRARLQPDPDLYSETEYPRVAGWSPLEALTDGRWMAIRAGSATELYDLGRDPQEQHDVAATQTAAAAALASRIDAIAASAQAGSARVSPDAEERLRALGYVSSSNAAPTRDKAQNPAQHISAWNAFEDALSALNARRPAALPALASLAAANRDASLFQTTYARALLDSGRPADALAAYRAAAKRWPADATLLHDLAVAARASGRLDDARDAEAASTALAPENPLAHNGAGLVAIDQNRPQDAAREFDRAAALDPNNASYWSNLGNARRALGDAASAKQAYEHAIAIDPRTADAANGLGVLLVEANRPGDAIVWFERAAAASPGFVEAQLNLGIALQQSGDRARAAKTYREVLAAPARFAREREAAAKLLASLGEAR